MRLSPLLALLLATSSLVVLAPGASAACGERLTSFGGVVGLTDAFVADTTAAACQPDTNAGTYSDLACVWLWGVDCDHLDDQAVATLNYECRWFTHADCL